MIRRLLPISYVWMVVNGLLAVVLPRQALRLKGRLLLRGYENPQDLEPEDWYVRSTRVAGVGMLVTGIVGLLVGGVEADEGETDEAEDSEAETGPIELDLPGDEDADGDED